MTMPSHHPDDALSALLDGEATSEEAAHVEACGRCAARTDELRRAANLIGSPVPPVADDRREAAIAAALDARVLSLEHRRRRMPPAWLLGAAAVVVLALGLLPLLARDGGDDAQDTAAGDAAATMEAPAADGGAEEDATTMFRAQPAPVDAGDLGTLDGDEIRDRVTAALLAPTPESVGATEADESATTTVAGAAAPPTCEGAVRAADPEAGALRLTARATVEGRAAQLLAFEVAGPDAVQLRVYVVADGDCDTVLRTVSFPAP